MHCFRMALEMPDSPGALWGLTFVSVMATLLGVNEGNLERLAVGGLVLMNWCSWSPRGLSGRKKVTASCSAFWSLVDAEDLSGFLSVGIH